MRLNEILKVYGLPQLELEICLAAVLGKNRSFILAHPEYQLNQAQITKILNFIKRREKNEPLAYIIGHREFYGLDFQVTPDTLIPRPETENLIEIVSQYLNSKKISQPKILEIGTGSGVIALVLAKKFPEATVVATDISEKALKIAQANAEKLKVKNVEFLLGDLLSPVIARSLIPKQSQNRDHRDRHANARDDCRYFDVIAANLPYIPQYVYDQLEPQIKDFEPAIALLGGSTGLEIYQRLFDQTDQVFPQTPIFYEVDSRIYQKN